MPEKSFLFDFGGKSPQDFNRVAQEIKQSGFGKLEVDAEIRQLTGKFGQDFLGFLKIAFKGLGLMDQIGLVSNEVNPVVLHVNENTDPADLMSQAWSKMAHDWAVIETPHAYAITMQTLLEFFMASGKPETILSLGSGPGLYETYLGYLFGQDNLTNKIKLVCVDAAKGMTLKHRKILDSLRFDEGKGIRKIKNVEAITGDMANLKQKTGSVGQIICNNSLQWVPDWKKAVAEMSRVMNPQGLGWLYLIVHLHPMVVRDEQGNTVFQFGDFTIPDLLDELENNCFDLIHTRQIAGKPGTGQRGSDMNRLFIKAMYTPNGNIKAWRSRSASVAITGAGFRKK